MASVLRHPARRRLGAGAGNLALAAASLALALACRATSADGTPVPEGLLAISTADLTEMKRRGRVRALVTYDKTEYFVVEGRQRGFEYELLKQYERHLNDGLGPQQLRTEIVYVPVPFEQLIPALVEGRGDIAAAGLTVTPTRERRVAFTIPYLTDVKEIVVAHASVQGLETLDDLAGRTLYVLRESSYRQHLRRLAERFEAKGLAPMRIVDSDAHLSTADILELVNAGIVELTVSDQHIAELWAKVLPDIRLHRDLYVNEGGDIAWAVRKDNPELSKSLDGFLEKNKRGTLIGNVLFERYFENTRWITNPLSEPYSARLGAYRTLFKKYANKYGFDWLLIAAIAYQESGLDASRESRKGAVGLMQVRPTTARDRNVGIDGIEDPEANVHAGVKYLAFLRDRYFADPELDNENRIYLTLAAYNAGPRKVRRFRTLAAQKGLDANLWFGNVERAALEVAGRETVRYVSNIYKYYIAYRRLVEIAERKAKFIESKTD